MRLKGSWSVCGGMEDVVYMNGGLEKIMENGELEEGQKNISNGSVCILVSIYISQYTNYFFAS